MSTSPEKPLFGPVQTGGDVLLDVAPRRRLRRVKIPDDKPALAENPLPPKESGLPETINSAVTSNGK